MYLSYLTRADHILLSAPASLDVPSLLKGPLAGAARGGERNTQRAIGSRELAKDIPPGLLNRVCIYKIKTFALDFSRYL